MHVPLSGYLYDMVTFGLIGDFKTLSYVGGSGYCAFAKGIDVANTATAAANAGGSWKNYIGISSIRLIHDTRVKSREHPDVGANMRAAARSQHEVQSYAQFHSLLVLSTRQPNSSGGPPRAPTEPRRIRLQYCSPANVSKQMLDPSGHPLHLSSLLFHPNIVLQAACSTKPGRCP